MKTSTLAEGPLGLGGEYIVIGTTIYNIESDADYAAATGPLRTYLDARTAAQTAEREAAQYLERVFASIRAKSAPVVSVMQMRLAAHAAGQLAALDAAMAALPAGVAKIRWQCNDVSVTRADLQALVPGTLSNAQADALFAAARAVV